MGVFDNFANRFRGDDDYDEDDEDLDEYDEEEEEQPRGRIWNSRKRQPVDDDEDEYDEPPRRTSIKGGNSGSRSSSGQSAPAVRSTRSNAPAAAGGRMQVRIIKPNSFDQARQIADTLLAHRTVLLNLEGLDINTAQRIVDFASGSCYALHGNFMKISQYIIVITPEDVDIAGDVAAAGGPEAAAAAAFVGAAVNQGMNGGLNNDAANPFMNSGMNSRMNGMY